MAQGNMLSKNTDKTAGNEARKAEARYLQEAKSWDSGRLDAVRTAEKTAWTVALVALMATAVASVTLFLLFPLKEVHPFFVRINEKTGVVDTIDRDDLKRNFDKMLIEHFIVRFVESAERRLVTSEVRENPQTKEKMTVPVVQKSPLDVDFLKNFAKPQVVNDSLSAIAQANTEAATTKRFFTVEAKVIEVKPLGNNLVEVRFQLESQPLDNPAEVIVRQRVALVSFVTEGMNAFSASDLKSMQGLSVNPIGFKVISYTPRNETLAPDEKLKAKPTGNAGNAGGEKVSDAASTQTATPINSAPSPNDVPPKNDMPLANSPPSGNGVPPPVNGVPPLVNETPSPVGNVPPPNNGVPPPLNN